MRELTLSPWGLPAAYALHCPDCGGNFLHHTEIKVFLNNSGSRGKCDVVSITDKTPINFTRRVALDNPSNDRDGLLIRFYCEFCPAEPVLAIYQHKGQTVIEWVEKPLTDTKVA